MRYLRKYNESFNNTTELRKALEIYAEELPFSMDNIHLEEMTTMKSKGCKSYRVSYQHIDDEITDKTKHIEDNPVDYVARRRNFSILNIATADVKKKVNIAFGKFAKKYDMIFSNPVVDMKYDNDVEYDNISVWFDLLEINEEL